MRITCTNFLSVVICVFLIYVQYFYSFPEFEDDKNFTVLSIKSNLPPFSKEIAISKVGETIEIFCTGERSDDLDVQYIIDTDYSRQFSDTREIFNDTTMRVLVSIEEQIKINVACAQNTFHVPGHQQRTLIVDGPPNVENFRCKSNNFISLHCAWTTTTLAAGFKLYVIIDNDRPAIICDIPVHEVSSGSYDLSCAWNKNRTPRYTPEAATLNFLMEYCNYTDCLNKSYEFNHLSIVKLDAPKGLHSNDRLQFTATGEVYNTIQWTIPRETLNLINGVDKRIIYSSFGSRPGEVVTSKIINDPKSGKVPHYTIAYILPCADRMYEVKVSIKTKQAQEEEYWSDYASIFYQTNGNSNSNDPSCEDPDSILETRETMARDLRTFRFKFKKEQLELKNKIKKLQEIVAQRD